MEIDIKRNRQIKLKGHYPKCAVKNEMENDNIKEIKKEISIGTEEEDKLKDKAHELSGDTTFSSIGATIADNFNVPMPEFGRSYLAELGVETE